MRYKLHLLTDAQLFPGPISQKRILADKWTRGALLSASLTLPPWFLKRSCCGVFQNCRPGHRLNSLAMEELGHSDEHVFFIAPSYQPKVTGRVGLPDN